MKLLIPTKPKLAVTGLLCLILPLCFVLRMIPAQWDILDLRELGGIVLKCLLAPPIRLFDFLTGSAFAPTGGGFVAFPHPAAVAFALLADVFIFYLIACVWAYFRVHRAQGSPGPRSTGS